jgi:hypothetical protein
LPLVSPLPQAVPLWSKLRCNLHPLPGFIALVVGILGIWLNLDLCLPTIPLFWLLAFLRQRLLLLLLLLLLLRLLLLPPPLLLLHLLLPLLPRLSLLLLTVPQFLLVLLPLMGHLSIRPKRSFA